MLATVCLPPLKVSLFALAFLVFLTHTVSAALLTHKQSAVAMAETSLIDGVTLSPDGKWVTYTITHRSVETNTLETVHFLQRIPQKGEDVAEAKPLKLPEGAVGIQWRPNSECLSMILGGTTFDHGREAPKEEARFACYDILADEMKIIPVDGRAVSVNYKWSPNGRYVAFLAPLPERAPLDPRRGVPHGLAKPGRVMALFMLNVKTGGVEQLTSGAVNLARSPLANFAWSPDERSLAVALDREMQSWGLNTELVVIDRRSRRMHSLVTRPGMNGRPCWSPDGLLIAFATHQGNPAYRTEGWPALVPAGGGKVVDFPNDSPIGFSSCLWSADGGTFYYVSRFAMAHRLARAHTEGRHAEVLPQASELPLTLEDNRSFSADGRVMAFTRESMTTPPDLFVVSLDEGGKPDGVPVRLTNLAPNFALGKNVRVEETSWPSGDGKFTIHGLLLTPASVEGRLPTVLYLWGGPNMVRPAYAWWHGAYLPLAARGYAVLIPNTRGRAGYGAAFRDAISTGKSRARLPIDDALAGLDYLIKRGIANPERMGVHGFSYGGYLAAYAITQTHVFKAAVMQDAVSLSLIGDGMDCNKKGWQRLLCRDLYGMDDPSDPEERARLIEESPALHASRVKTPTLLLSATKSGPIPPYDASLPNAWLESGPFYYALRRFDTPAAFFAYDEGHVFERPAAIADSLVRAVEWLDYWLRGLPFPTSVRAKEYGINDWGGPLSYQSTRMCGFGGGAARSIYDTCHNAVSGSRRLSFAGRLRIRYVPGLNCAMLNNPEKASARRKLPHAGHGLLRLQTCRHHCPECHPERL